MKVSGILRVKGNTLFTVTPDEPLARAVDIMAEKDIGSLVVMEHGELVGMLAQPASRRRVRRRVLDELEAVGGHADFP